MEYLHIQGVFTHPHLSILSFSHGLRLPPSLFLSSPWVPHLSISTSSPAYFFFIFLSFPSISLFLTPSASPYPSLSHGQHPSPSLSCFPSSLSPRPSTFYFYNISRPLLLYLPHPYSLSLPLNLTLLPLLLCILAFSHGLHPPPCLSRFPSSLSLYPSSFYLYLLMRPLLLNLSLHPFLFLSLNLTLPPSINQLYPPSIFFYRSLFHGKHPLPSLLLPFVPLPIPLTYLSISPFASSPSFSTSPLLPFSSPQSHSSFFPQFFSILPSLMVVYLPLLSHFPSSLSLYPPSFHIYFRPLSYSPSTVDIITIEGIARSPSNTQAENYICGTKDWRSK